MFSRFLNACFSDFYHACYYCILPAAAIISISYFPKVSNAFKWICVLLIFTCISEFSALLAGLHHGSNGIVYNIFTPIEYFMYANIYSLFLSGKKWNRILNGSAAIFLLLGILNILFFQPVNATPTNLMNVEMPALAFLSLLLFIEIRERPVYENILSEGVFWFNSAVLLYYSFSILTWAFYEIISNMKNAPKINGHMLLLSSTILYALFVFSILLNGHSQDKLRLKHV